jgi:hypothetical protein
MPNDAIVSPGEAVDAYFEKRLQPVLTGFRVLRRKPLGSRFGREVAVHLQNKREIIRTAHPYFKRLLKFVSPAKSFWLHNTQALVVTRLL